MPRRREETAPQCDTGEPPAASESGQPRVCAPPPSSRLDPRVLSPCGVSGEATYLKISRRRFGPRVSSPYRDFREEGPHVRPFFVGDFPLISAGNRENPKLNQIYS